MSEKKDAYRQKYESQLKEWEAQAALLMAKAENAGSDARVKIMEKLEKLDKKKGELREQLDALNKAGEEAADGFKKKLESSWNELKDGLDKATKELKS